VVLTADSTLARSTRRRQTSTGWNTAYTGANRYTLPLDEKPPADDALHPMPTERQVLNAARDRHQHWELTTEAMPAALLGELCQATAISCRPVLEAEDGLAAGATGYRLAPRLPGARRAPAVANSGWCWRATPRSMAAIRCWPISASSSAPRNPPLPAP
jgi:hypothetical protein